MKKRIVAVVLCMAMILSLAACGGNNGGGNSGGGNSGAKTKITLATGGTSGMYYAVGNALATTLNEKLTKSTLEVTSTGASKANVQEIASNDSQMAILQSDVLNYAHQGSGGEAMFQGNAQKGALWVAGLYNETVQLVSKTDITDISQLKGKSVVVGDVGSGTALNAEQVLEAYGMTFNDIKVINGSFSTGADMLKNGQCDAVFTVAGTPTAALMELASTYTFNVLSLSPEAVKFLTDKYPFLVQENMPANTYKNQDKEVVCVAVKAVLVASDKLSEDVVYEITKALFENQKALGQAASKLEPLTNQSAVDGSFDLHPGALKYYKEAGIIK